MEIIKRLNKWRNKSELNRITQNIQTRFQICEYNGVLWITFNGARVIPESMLAEDAITTAVKLRKLFIKEYYGHKD